MTRTVSGIVTAAVGQDVTTPVYLIYMAWDLASPDINRYICTWDTDITWNSITWAASGASVKNLSADNGVLELPNGDGDPWTALVNTQIPRDRVIEVYEHHTSTASPQGSDAVLIFSGRMDSASIQGLAVKIDMVEGRTNKGFPPESIGPAVHNHLLAVGSKLYWNNDVLTVN